VAGIGDHWGTREELLHPRDAHGRFRQTWRMPANIIEKITGLLAAFRPKMFASDAHAGQYAFSHAKPARFARRQGRGPTSATLFPGLDARSDTMEGFHETQAALRAGKMDPSTREFVSHYDRLKSPTEDDLIVSRRVNPEAFGLTAQTMHGAPGTGEGGIEDLTGKEIHDAGYFPANLGTPIGQSPILMTVAVPKGTQAVFPGNGGTDREIILDRSQFLRVTKVSPDGRGGYYVAAVVTPHAEGEAPRALKVGEPAAPGTPKSTAVPEILQQRTTPQQVRSPMPVPGAVRPGQQPVPVVPRTERVVSPAVGGTPEAGVPQARAPETPKPPAPEPGAPLGEAAARARQAKIDHARSRAELLTELDELYANKASVGAMEHRLKARARANNVPEGEIAPILDAVRSGDEPKARALAGELGKREGIELVGHTGQSVKFTRGEHRPIDKPIPDGTAVEIVRPGWTYTAPDGERITVPPTVEVTGAPEVGKPEAEKLPDATVRRLNDPKTTIPQLREIAKEHGIKVPSSVTRKADIRDHILKGPQAPAKKAAPAKAAKPVLSGSPLLQTAGDPVKARLRRDHVDGGELRVQAIDPGDEVQDTEGNWRIVDQLRVHDRVYVAGYDADGNQIFRVNDYMMLPVRKGQAKSAKKAVPAVSAVPKPRKTAKLPEVIPSKKLSPDVVDQLNDPKITVAKMKEIAREHGIKIPSSITKKTDIKDHLLKRSGPSEGGLAGRLDAPEQRDAFKAAWIAAKREAPQGSSRREMNEVYLDIRSGKITPAEGIRRLDNGVEIDRHELADMERTLKRPNLTAEERKALEQRIEMQRQSIDAKVKASKFLRDHFSGTGKKEGAPGKLSTDPAIREVQVDNRIRAAYRTLRQHNDNEWIGLAELREELGDDLSREEVDAALRRLGSGDYDGPGRPHLVALANLKAITPRDRAAAVRLGGEDNTAISFEDPSPRPVPKASGRPIEPGPSSPKGIPSSSGLRIRDSLAGAKDLSSLTTATQDEFKRITGRDLKVEFSPDADLTTSQEHMEGVLRVAEQWPDADIREVRWFSGSIGEIGGGGGKRWPWAVGGNGAIMFNSAYSSHAGRTRYLEELAAGVAGWRRGGTGFHPRHSDNPAAVAVHEFGHLLDKEGRIHLQVIRLVQRRATAGRVPHGKMIRREVSDYADIGGVAELIAEAFMDVTVNGDDAGQLSREIVDLLRAEYKRARGK
jgi:ADP-ribosyltransferase exoenzyme